jgi:hypothetical protein
MNLNTIFLPTGQQSHKNKTCTQCDLEQEVPLNMDALLALSIVTFFEFLFQKKILPLGNKKSHATHTKD